jgi:hypothetical protein
MVYIDPPYGIKYGSNGRKKKSSISQGFWLVI